MTGLVLSARGIFKASLCLFYILTNSNGTLPSLHSLPKNNAYPKLSVHSPLVCYSVHGLNCSSKKTYLFDKFGLVSVYLFF